MHTLRTLLGIWVFLSFVLGIGVSQIPWAEPDGFHGKGFPFAIVYWDYAGDSKVPKDYPNLLAPILNITAFLIVGSIVILMIYWCVGRVRKGS